MGSRGVRHQPCIVGQWGGQVDWVHRPQSSWMHWHWALSHLGAMTDKQVPSTQQRWIKISNSMSRHTLMAQTRGLQYTRPTNGVLIEFQIQGKSLSLQFREIKCWVLLMPLLYQAWFNQGVDPEVINEGVTHAPDTGLRTKLVWSQDLVTGQTKHMKLWNGRTINGLSQLYQQLWW